jgi:hypothetical protein
MRWLYREGTDGAQGERSSWTPRAHGLGQKRASTGDAMHVLPRAEYPFRQHGQTGLHSALTVLLSQR